MVAEKIETLVVFMKSKKKKIETTWCPGWALGPPPRADKKKINEIQVTKIKKYEWFTMKSNIGDIWDKF